MLATRIFNTPLLLHPAKVEVLLGALSDHRGIISRHSINNEVEKDKKTANILQVHGQIAVIKIHGTLVHRSSYLDAALGLTGYEEILTTYHEAMDNRAIDAVFLDIDSGGGEAAGCFDLIESMIGRINEKPVHAHINEFSASGAYAITTIADHISIARTGYTGSIGAIVVHKEFTKYLDIQGITATIVRSGRDKAKGNPYEKLSDKDLSAIQADLDHLRDIFISTIAQNRRISEEIIRGTEAAMFGAEDALKLNLVDAVMSAEEAAIHLVDSLNPQL